MVKELRPLSEKANRHFDQKGFGVLGSEFGGVILVGKRIDLGSELNPEKRYVDSVVLAALEMNGVDPTTADNIRERIITEAEEKTGMSRKEILEKVRKGETVKW